MDYKLRINGEIRSVRAEPDTPLLWILREHLELFGTKYGCGVAQCGACMVHLNGNSIFSCQVPVSSVGDQLITTIEGLSENGDHPLQEAWVEEQVPQCGYCQSGQIMRAADLLAHNAAPSRDEITSHMRTNLCRCGTYPRIVKAIESAALKMSTLAARDEEVNHG